MPCVCARLCCGLALGGQREGPVNVGLAVRHGCVAKDFGLGACGDVVALLSGLTLEDSVDQGVAAKNLSPGGRWTAQKFDAMDAVGNCTICPAVGLFG